MQDKKFLKVCGKAVKDGQIVSQAVAVVPYKKGGSAKLPDVAPFNTNVWLSGDDGYNMMWIEFTTEGKLLYFYNDYFEFVDGKIHAERCIKGVDMIFDFELIDRSKNADYAIALKVRKVLPDEKIDESCSKFFGKPCVPERLVDAYPDDGVFFAQIRCEDLKDLDPDCRLPHNGYLYFFLDAEMYPSDQLYMMVDHTEKPPKFVVDDYNDEANIKLTETYVISFEKVDASYAGTKLLGCPSNDVDDDNQRGQLLLQYDPMEFQVPFLETCDGYAFVFFGDDDSFDGVEYVVWGS